MTTIGTDQHADDEFKDIVDFLERAAGQADLPEASPYADLTRGRRARRRRQWATAAGVGAAAATIVTAVAAGGLLGGASQSGPMGTESSSSETETVRTAGLDGTYVLAEARKILDPEGEHTRPLSWLTNPDPQADRLAPDLTGVGAGVDEGGSVTVGGDLGWHLDGAFDETAPDTRGRISIWVTEATFEGRSELLADCSECPETVFKDGGRMWSGRSQDGEPAWTYQAPDGTWVDVEFKDLPAEIGITDDQIEELVTSPRIALPKLAGRT